MTRIANLSALVVWIGAAPWHAYAGRERFQTPNNGPNLGVWRITNDPTIRDWANYHNTQCWSPDGRYLCYTRYGFEVDRGRRRERTSVHVYDLLDDEGRLVGEGHSPRWANGRNWLFYVYEDSAVGNIVNDRLGDMGADRILELVEGNGRALASR